MNLFESSENYLEIIYLIQQKKGSCRSVDIINELGFTKSSISKAVSNLKNEGFVVVDENKQIILTDKGIFRAKYVYERHTVISEFFQLIGVPEEIADADACRMEHDISDLTFDKFKYFVNKLKDYKTK